MQSSEWPSIPAKFRSRLRKPMADQLSQKPLWGAADQHERLLELTAATDDARKEHPLRRDVRSLGVLLGRVLVEQAGQALFDSVEHLRTLLIEHREQQQPALLDRAQQYVRGLDLA